MVKARKIGGMTPRQEEFLTFIRAFNRKYGTPPTYREIAIGMGCSSKGTVSAVIERLERHGKVQRSESGGLLPTRWGSKRI